MGPDGTAHGSPLAGAVSTEAAPKVTARLGRDLTELPLPPQPLGFGRPVGLEMTSCSPLIQGGLPGDLPEDDAHQPLPWDGRPACSREKKRKSKTKHGGAPLSIPKLQARGRSFLAWEATAASFGL